MPAPSPGATSSVTDPETRALKALWMKQAGQSVHQIAAAFNVPESTITADLTRLRTKEIEEARQTAAEEYYADFRASQRLLVAKLIAIHDRAAAKGDERAALDAPKELRQLTRQDVDVLRDLGAFKALKVTSLREREAEDEMSLPRIANDFMRAIAEMYNDPSTGSEDDEPLEIDLEAIRHQETERVAADPADPDLS
jgi:predicted transcriptional regulator